MGCVNCKPSRSSLYAVEKQRNKSSPRKNKKSLSSFIRKFFGKKDRSSQTNCSAEGEVKRSESVTAVNDGVSQKEEEVHEERSLIVIDEGATPNGGLSGLVDGGESETKRDEEGGDGGVSQPEHGDCKATLVGEGVISKDSGIVSMEEMTVDDSGSLAVKTEFDEIRERRYKKVIVELKRSLAETDAIVQKYRKLNRECVHKIKDLSTLRPLEERFNPKGVVYVDAQVDCVLVMYFHFVKKLYKAKREKALCEAKIDRYEAKLNPKWNHSDKYSTHKSSYLSPIQEEEEEEEDL